MNAYSENIFQLSFEEMVFSGGDERIAPNTDSNLNKYHVNPVDFTGIFNRGSCTCSPFSPDGYKAAYALYHSLSIENFEHFRSEQVRRIKALVNYTNHDNFDVFFAPSGSDLCYYQLLFAQLIYPGRKICNIVTCPEELGSGSVLALGGKFFAHRNQFGLKTEIGAVIDPSLEVISRTLPARDSLGQIINQGEAILDIVRANIQDYSINANLVIGSKSGIENNIAVVSQAPESVLWTIDLCQFRASRVLINGLLGMNCSVMLTGSKFYQSPPFCAVLLVPKTITERFSGATAKVVKPFSRVFSRHDIPREFDAIRNFLPDFYNPGLLLRWEAALCEMEFLSSIEGDRVNDCIRSWNNAVVSRLSASDCFELIPVHEVTNKTIVSFRVRGTDGAFFTHEQLQTLYRDICSSRVEGLNGYDRVLLGQPVKYGDQSFIRIALGASDLRNFAATEFDPANDLTLIAVLEQRARSLQ